MIKQKNERALSTYCWLRRYWDVVMFRVLKELLWICLYDRGGNPFTGSISKRGGVVFEAFPSRCSDCTAILTIYGFPLWPVDTCFYRCCMFVVLLRLDHDTDLFDVVLPYAPDRLLSDSLCAGFFFFFK